MHSFHSYSILHIFRRRFPSSLFVFFFFCLNYSSANAQNKTIVHGRDSQKDSLSVNTGDKYYDSGGAGGARFPDQPGNYLDCTDPISEATNCSSIFTFCASNGDTVALNFIDYLIVTGDGLRIYSGNTTKGNLVFNSKDQGVSINGMRLTTGTLIKSKSTNGCLTVEMFASTIGNALGWDADFILYKKKTSTDPCTPMCMENVTVTLPTDTCFSTVNTKQFISNPNTTCSLNLKLFYPKGSDDLNNLAVNMSHAGKRFLYQITDTAGSSCVGYVKVNESIVPMPDCSIDTVSCLEWNNTFSHITKLKSCNNKGFRVINQKFNPYDCGSTIIGFISRNLEVFSDTGIIETCLDTIYIQKSTIDSLQKPTDISFNCQDLKINSIQITPIYLLNNFDINHDYFIDGTSQRIIPLLNYIPFPDSSSFCSVSINYNDLVIPGCGKSYKIRRQWSIKSACEKKDSIIIQYINVVDNTAPVVKQLSSVSYTVDKNTCLSKIVLDSIPNIEDCDGIRQKVELSYRDPANPSNQIVISEKLPVSLSLPIGTFNLKYTFTDACFNVTQQNQCLWINDNSKIDTKIDTSFTKYVDPGSCASRIYAHDFDKYITSGCTKKFQISIAFLDSVNYYQNHWENKLKAECSGLDSWNANTQKYQALIDRWITTFIFNDYLDLLPCQQNKIVLKISRSDFVPDQEPLFQCSTVKWSAYVLDSFFRAQFNVDKSCTQRYGITCLSEMNKLITKENVKYNFPTLSYLNDLSCQSSYFHLESSNAYITQQTIYTNLKVVDTLLPVIPSLPDISFYENEWPSACCNTVSCKGDAYTATSWPGSINCIGCDTNNFPRYFGGPVNTNVTYDALGYFRYNSCSVYDTFSYNKPIYCRTALSGISITSFSKDSLFSKILINHTTIPSNALNLKLNCSTSWKLTHSDTLIKAKSCGYDTIMRVWHISHPCIFSKTFNQKIILKKRSDFEVLFPKDARIDCSAKLIKDSSEIKNLFGFPIVKSTSASCIDISYKDSLISESKGDYCLLTQRMWRIEDKSRRDFNADKLEFIVNDSLVGHVQNRFCSYRNLKDGGDGIMYYKQIITYIDTVAPVITVHDTVVVGSKCQGPAFDLSIQAIDDCTPEEVLFTYHSLDLHSNGVYENNFSRIKNILHFNEALPVGTHLLRTTCIDLCGNADTLYSKIIITDDGAPVALCVQSSVLVPIPPSKRIDIFAKDFDAGSLAGCDNGFLQFSFSRTSSDTMKTFTCDSIGDKSLIVFVSNLAGKQSECQIKLQVTSEGTCNDTIDNISINGNILSVNKDGINKVEVKTNALLMKAQTDNKGIYSLPSLVAGQNITIIPTKTDDPLNGLSTIDLLLIERHIKGLSTITDPYLLIAADINRSSSITITDLVELRKMILGSIASFSNNKNWLFIPQSYRFNDPLSPWIFPETISYNPITSTLSDVNFIGIKVGDVNKSATVNAVSLEERQNRIVQLEVVENIIGPEKYRYDFYANNQIPNCHSFQLFFTQKDYWNIQELKTSLTNSDFHFHAAYDELNVLWTNSNFNQNAINPFQTLFSIYTDRKVNDLNLTNNKTSFFYNKNIQSEIKLKKTFVNQPSPTIQVFPNPSCDFVNIRFYINDLQTDKISLTNVHGLKLDQLLPKPKSGWNSILLNKSDLYGCSEFFFSMISRGNFKTMKFIML